MPTIVNHKSRPLIKCLSADGRQAGYSRKLIVGWYEHEAGVYLLEECKKDSPQTGCLVVSAMEGKTYKVKLTCNSLGQALAEAKDRYGIDVEAWKIIGNKPTAKS